jgi:hypothetical protein
MNKEIMLQIGFNKEMTSIENGKRQTCSEKIDLNDFRNTLSLKEFKINKMCQKCQDDIFGDD